VGELAERIWRGSGAPGEPDIELLGIRAGETRNEVLTGEGERLGPERRQGLATIDPGNAAEGPALVADRLDAAGGRAKSRAVWLEAMASSVKGG